MGYVIRSSVGTLRELVIPLITGAEVTIEFFRVFYQIGSLAFLEFVGISSWLAVAVNPFGTIMHDELAGAHGEVVDVRDGQIPHVRRATTTVATTALTAEVTAEDAASEPAVPRRVGLGVARHVGVAREAPQVIALSRQDGIRRGELMRRFGTRGIEPNRMVGLHQSTCLLGCFASSPLETVNCIRERFILNSELWIGVSDRHQVRDDNHRGLCQCFNNEVIGK